MTDQLWEIIVPSATTNLAQNPSMENSAGVDLIAAGSNTVARSSEQHFIGPYGRKCTYQDSTRLLVFQFTPTASTTYYLQCMLYVSADWDGGNIRIDAQSFTSAVVTYNHIYTHGTDPTGEWIYLETKVAFDTDVAGQISISTTSAPTAGRYIYVDALQCEANASYPTTYCDGDQEDSEWNGAPHGSTSSRSALSRAGGRVVNLGDYGLTVRFNDGIGLPSSQHQTQSLANMPGAIFKGRKVLPRVLTLTTVAPGTSAANLHSKRKDLLEAINPDGVPDDQPVILRYLGANSSKPVEIKATYDTGMGFGARFKIEEFPLRLIAYDPYWRELGSGAAALTLAESVADADYIAARVDGDWQALGTGMNLPVRALAIESRFAGRSLYAGGDFTTADGNTVNYIAKWTGVSWAAIGSGPGLDGAVYALMIDSLGLLWVGGVFRAENGGTPGDLDRVAYTGGSTWQSAGTGFNGNVYALVMDRAGSIYAAGAFTTTGGPTTLNRVGKWNGVTWDAVGSGPGLNNQVWAAAVGPDNSVYFGGEFTDISGGPGGTYNRVIKWTGSAFSAIGTGMNDIVRALAIGPDGALYAGGDFTTADGNTVNHVARWTGATWEALGSGVNDDVWSLGFDDDGNLIAGGIFTTAGGLSVLYAAVWNGSSWTPLPFKGPGNPTIYSLVANKKDLYLANGDTGTATASALTTVTNPGTAKAYPKIVISRSGGTSARIAWIKNETTGDTLYCNHSLLDGETLVIDLDPANRSVVSSVFGDVIGSAILRGSDTADFHLLPRANSISVFVDQVGSPTMTGYLVYPIRHGSADGAAT